MNLNEVSGVNTDEVKKVRIILKNRCEITVRCKDFIVIRSGDCSFLTCEICDFESGDYPLYIDKSEVAAIIYEKDNGSNSVIVDYAIKNEEILGVIKRIDKGCEIAEEDKTKIALLLGELSGRRKGDLRNNLNICKDSPLGNGKE